MSQAWGRKAPEHANLVSIPCTLCPIPYPEEMEIQLTVEGSDSVSLSEQEPMEKTIGNWCIYHTNRNGAALRRTLCIA